MKIEKKQEKVWRFQKNSVPLHPQFSKSAESTIKNDAPVAQLVEHLTLNQGVQSSSLCGCTKQKDDRLFLVRRLSLFVCVVTSADDLNVAK